MSVPVVKSTINVCRTLVPSSLPSARSSSPLSTHPSSPPSSHPLGDSVGAWRMLRLRNYLTDQRSAVCKSEKNATATPTRKKRREEKKNRMWRWRKNRNHTPLEATECIYIACEVALLSIFLPRFLHLLPDSRIKCGDATKVAVDMLYYWQWK